MKFLKQQKNYVTYEKLYLKVGIEGARPSLIERDIILSIYSSKMCKVYLHSVVFVHFYGPIKNPRSDPELVSSFVSHRENWWLIRECCSLWYILLHSSHITRLQKLVCLVKECGYL